MASRDIEYSDEVVPGVVTEPVVYRVHTPTRRVSVTAGRSLLAMSMLSVAAAVAPKASATMADAHAYKHQALPNAAYDSELSPRNARRLKKKAERKRKKF